MGRDIAPGTPPLALGSMRARKHALTEGISMLRDQKKKKKRVGCVRWVPRFVFPDRCETWDIRRKPNQWIQEGGREVGSLSLFVCLSLRVCPFNGVHLFEDDILPMQMHPCPSYPVGGEGEERRSRRTIPRVQTHLIEDENRTPSSFRFVFGWDPREGGPGSRSSTGIVRSTRLSSEGLRFPTDRRERVDSSARHERIRS